MRMRLDGTTDTLVSICTYIAHTFHHPTQVSKIWFLGRHSNVRAPLFARCC